MGQTNLLAVATTLGLALVAADEVAAQGPVYRERWGYLHLEHRRAELWQELRSASAEARTTVAGLLLQQDQGVPFAPVARALAHLRGRSADAAWLVRASVGSYVLPEVCDPDARTETCRDVHVSVFLPFSLPLPGELAFDVRVRDSKGDERWRGRITEGTSLEDLRMARAHLAVPGRDLPDGAYTLEVRTRIADAEPVATDPRLAWTFHVLRGYQQRAEKAMGEVVQAQPGLAALPKAMLGGLADQVGRAYHGEAFAVRSDAVVELQRLERALQNLAAEQPLLDGLEGDRAVGLPAGDAPPLQVVVRAASVELEAPPRPVVVFLSGTPTYDLTMRRPSSPATRDPAWLADAMRGFAAASRWHQVFVESPGGGRDYLASLEALLTHLPSVVPGGAGPLVVVAEREAASVLGLHLPRFAERLRGVVLVGGGLFPRTHLAKLGGLPVRFGEVAGLPSGEAMAGLVAFATSEARAEGGPSPVAMLPGEPAPWIAAVPHFAAAIEAFFAECLAR